MKEGHETVLEICTVLMFMGCVTFTREQNQVVGLPVINQIIDRTLIRSGQSKD